MQAHSAQIATMLEPPQTLATPTARTEYTCPMHPEIVRDAPGSCPICGMALEPKTITGGEVENEELLGMTRRFKLSLILTIPLLLLAMSYLIPGQPVQRAVSMRDSLNALPGQSMAMPSDKREQLTAQVKNVERMAGMLDEAAVANKADAMHEHHKSMDESLDTIKGLYPEGVMPASMPMADRMRDKGMGMHDTDKKMGEMPGRKAA